MEQIKLSARMECWRVRVRVLASASARVAFARGVTCVSGRHEPNVSRSEEAEVFEDVSDDRLKAVTESVEQDWASAGQACRTSSGGRNRNTAKN